MKRYENLLMQIDRIILHETWTLKNNYFKALRAVVELHQPDPDSCECCGPILDVCGVEYPCETVQIIEKKLGLLN